jgi:hypothetical protein
MQVVVFISFEVIQVVREEDLVFGFTCRACCNDEKSGQFSFTFATATLGDIGGDRCSGFPEMGGKPESFVRRKLFRMSVDIEHQTVCFLPDVELPEIPNERLRIDPKVQWLFVDLNVFGPIRKLRRPDAKPAHYSCDVLIADS